MRLGLDAARDETFTLTSFASCGLLLIESTVVVRRNGGVTGSVTGVVILALLLSYQAYRALSHLVTGC